MIGSLNGVVAAVGEDTALIDVNGVGYVVQAASRTLGRLSVGAPTKLFVETHVREDAIRLFGFSSEEERAWEKELLDLVKLGGPEIGSIIERHGAAKALAALRALDDEDDEQG